MVYDQVAFSTRTLIGDYGDEIVEEVAAEVEEDIEDELPDFLEGEDFKVFE